MRWTPKVRPEPKDGDKQVRKEFALFPVKLSDGDMIWLESYWVRHQYHVVSDYDGIICTGWETLETWQDKP